MSETSEITAGGRPKRLSLCMIVKNEAHQLGACLADAQPVVDEIVVVDTGSDDRTVAVAREYGARVFHFPWMDDFAAARNESIRQARGEYILWLDADDRIMLRDQKSLAALKRDLGPERKQGYALLVSCRNGVGEAAVYYQLRIFPNVAGVAFEGAVHENLVPAMTRLGIPIVKNDTCITHTGYDDEQSMIPKLHRNLGIMQSAKPAHLRTPLDHYYLAQCHFGLKNYPECLALLTAAREAGPAASFYKASYAMMADCHLQLGRIESGLRLLRQAVKEFPESGYCHYLLGAGLTLAEDYCAALAAMDTATACGVEVESTPVPVHIEGRILYYAGRCREGLGNHDDARRTYDQALRAAPHDTDVLRALGLLCLRSGEPEAACNYLEQVRQEASCVKTDIWLMLGRLRLYLQQPQRAWDIYTELLAHDPDQEDALVGLLQAGIDAGDAEKLYRYLDMLMRQLGIKVRLEGAAATDLDDRMATVARYLESVGKPEPARRVLQMATDLGETRFSTDQFGGGDA